MKRLGGLLATGLLVVLAACNDTGPSGPETGDGAQLLSAPNPCTDCVYGPTTFVRRNVENNTVTFSATPGDYTFNIEDDGDPATYARVILNGTLIVGSSDLLGGGGPLSFTVTLLASNTMTVAVRGGREHRVTIWINGTTPPPPPDPIDVQPDVSERLPGGTQQFAVVSGAAGPYTWSVNGVDGGDATYGMIDANGFYTAPGSVPSPATFPVCARVTADPTNSDCSDMTISPIPTAGEDVVVYNDVNVLDDISMANPNNILMLQNLLGYTASGPRASGTEVLVDGGHGPICGVAFCGSSFSTFAAQVTSLGLTMTIDTGGDLSTIASNVKILVLWLPTVFYSVPEINAMKAFSSQGGRIIFIGEHAGFYGGGFAAQNDFLTNMGAQMTNVGDFIDCGYNTQPAASLRMHQITTGMTDVTMACSSQIILGPNDFALYYDLSNSKVLSGVAKINTLPLPAPIVPAGRVSSIPRGWKPTADARGNPLN
jgi:hypothetical protein